MKDIYAIKTIGERLAGNSYPGRGIIAGTTPDGKCAVAAYFIMGRSANSRNRIFTEKNGEVFTEPFDASLVTDPSLIIYAAVRRYGNDLIVTNGNQTDTVFEGLCRDMSFQGALESRTFEPDAPNYTPRISALLTVGRGRFSYQMNIIKSVDAAGTAPVRQTFAYPSVPGLGHFLHTYVCDGSPIPSFAGEPERIAVGSSPSEYAAEIWDALDEQNRISLYVRFTEIASGKYSDIIINKNA